MVSWKSSFLNSNISKIMLEQYKINPICLYSETRRWQIFRQRLLFNQNTKIKWVIIKIHVAILFIIDLLAAVLKYLWLETLQGDKKDISQNCNGINLRNYQISIFPIDFESRVLNTTNAILVAIWVRTI